MNPSPRYFPAIVRSEHDSALDALVALDLPRGEAMDLLVASWHQPGCAILAAVDGGRPVAAVPLADGRWAACNTFPEQVGATFADAERSLGKLLRRGRYGLVASVPAC
ncbi:MAG: hypothetical protein HYU78_16205 [Rhodocyclales bacterium]|nr:hypothetical protein [Rhodocyclales bacterium]